jgi:ferredoxin
MDDDGKASAIREDIVEEDIEKAREAADSCPVEAIEIE